MIRTSQIVASVLLIPYVACGVVLCLLVLDTEYCNSPYYVDDYGPSSTLAIPTSTNSTSSTESTSSTLSISSTISTLYTSPQPTTSSTMSTSSLSTTTSPSIPTSSSSDTTSDTTSTPVDLSATTTLSTITTDTTPSIFPSSDQSFENIYCAGAYHGLWSLMGTLMVGFSIIVYRLLSGTRIRIVKYIHLILHVFALISFGIGLLCIFTHEDYSISYDRMNYHGITSWVAFVIFCVQFIVSITKFRHYVSFFHDLIGIWIFICCVTCCLSGKRTSQLDYVEINQELFCGLSYVCFTCVLVIILSPFFEWDMLGPL